MSADQNFEARANLNKQNKGTALNLMEAFDPQPKKIVRDALGDIAVIPAHQDLILHQTSFDITFNPTTAVNGNLLSTGGQIDINIPEGGGGGTVAGVLLEFDISNTTGADCTLVPAPLLFRDITLYANGGSLLVQTIQGDHLFTDLAFLSTETLASIASSVNTTVNLNASINHPNNTTRTYNVPIYSFFLTQGNIYLPAIKNDLMFCLNLQPGSDTIIIGAIPTISNLKLHIIGSSFPTKHHNEILGLYNANQYNFRYTNCLTNSIPVNMAASSTYNLILSGIQGMMAGTFLVFRTGTVGAAIYTFSNLFSGSFDIVDSNNRTLLGAPKRGDYNRSWDWKDQFLNNIAQTIALYHVSHAASLYSVVDSGTMTGFNYYDNNTRIKITTDAAWVPGFCSVDLFFKQYAMLRVINGRIQPLLLS